MSKNVEQLKRRESDQLEVVVDRQQKEPWHLSKSVPVSLILAILIQSAALVGWGATFKAQFVAFMENTNTRLTAVEDGGYRRQEAMLALQLRDERISALKEDIREVKDKIGAVNTKLDSGFDRLEDVVTRRVTHSQPQADAER